MSDPPGGTAVVDRPAASPPPPRPVPSRRRWLRIAVWAVLLVVLLYLPFVLESALLNAGEYVMIGVVGAIGLTLVVGQAGQLSLAHGFFMLVGGTFYCLLAGPDPNPKPGVLNLGLPPLLALVLAVAVAAGFGLAFAPVSGRLRGIYLGVASLALIFIGLYLGQILPSLTGGAASGRDPAAFTLFGLDFTGPGTTEILGFRFGKPERMWYLFLLLCAVAFVVARLLVKARTGRAWRAVRDNESAATAMGVSVLRAKAGAFAVSSAFAGLAGVMTAMWFDVLKPDESEFGTYGVNASIAFLAMVIIGGLGSVGGSVFGAIIVFGLPKFLELYGENLGLSATAESGFTPAVFSLYIYGAAVVLIVLFEPGGLTAIGRRIAAAAGRRRAGGPPPTTPDATARRGTSPGEEST